MRIEAEKLSNRREVHRRSSKAEKHIRKSNDLWIPNLGGTDGDVKLKA